MEMTKEELKLFQEVNGQAKEDEAENIIDYFEGRMPDELRERIDCAIYTAFDRQETEDAIRNYCLDCFTNLSQEEYDEMTMDELINRCMEDNCDGVLDFYVVEISFD